MVRIHWRVLQWRKWREVEREQREEQREKRREKEREGRPKKEVGRRED